MKQLLIPYEEYLLEQKLEKESSFMEGFEAGQGRILQLIQEYNQTGMIEKVTGNYEFALIGLLEELKNGHL